MERERLALDIKRSLFGDGLDGLDVVATRLEEALAKIPAHTIIPAVGVGYELSKEEDDGLASYRVGLIHEAIHFHSWRPSAPCWLWISKASAAAGVGFPARQEEVHRFGHLARRVRRVGPPPPLSRSVVVW